MVQIEVDFVLSVDRITNKGRSTAVFEIPNRESLFVAWRGTLNWIRLFLKSAVSKRETILRKCDAIDLSIKRRDATATDRMVLSEPIFVS
jgi:hypothetical protein